MDKRPSASALTLLLLLWLIVSPALACPYNGSKCKDCIAKQMKCGCPSCGPVLRCMARCLWGGSAKANCIKRCDCDTGPKLSGCKKCMSKCKCSCMVY